MSTFILDIDGTICHRQFRDYETATPDKELIAIINRLYTEGSNIKLYTARGMGSNGDDPDLAKKVNLEKTTKWLKNNGVLYHELIFGKPNGDYYIDDKAISINEFKRKFSNIRGNSGCSITVHKGKTDPVLTKKYPSKEALKNVRLWNKRFLINIEHPKITIPNMVSSTNTSLTMEFVNGVNLYDETVKADNFLLAIEALETFRRIIPTENKCFSSYTDKIRKRLDGGRDELFIIKELISIQEFMNSEGSFSHDDFTLGNIISTEGGITIIDPNQNDAMYSGWLMDLARLRMSTFCKYESVILGRPVNPMVDLFDRILSERYKDYQGVVKVLLMASLLRLKIYNKDKVKVIEKMMEEVYRAFPI